LLLSRFVDSNVRKPCADSNPQAALGESEATIQHLSRERDAAIGERREVNSLLETLRKDYDKSLAEVGTPYKFSGHLLISCALSEILRLRPAKI
jgi:hypothetical protein